MVINFSGDVNSDIFEVKKFVEKPNQKTAESYINDGCYLWNSGMFMFDSNQLLQELSSYCPEILNPVRQSFDNAT